MGDGKEDVAGVFVLRLVNNNLRISASDDSNGFRGGWPVGKIDIEVDRMRLRKIKASLLYAAKHITIRILGPSHSHSWDPPGHARRSPSIAATTVAAVIVPTTLVMVRNISGTRSSPSSSVRPASGNPAVANAGARLTMLADGTLATVSEVRNTAAPAWTGSPTPSAPPYRRATNSTATAWNRALPARPMLAPSGNTKRATESGMPRSVSAAASITGREASDEVVENAINAGARTARKNRPMPSRATNATAGR